MKNEIHTKIIKEPERSDKGDEIEKINRGKSA